MEKTFREVIKDIKPGEIWEAYPVVRITNNSGKIFIDTLRERIQFSEIDKEFKLKREEYTFEEAFKAYEEGKEIETIRTKVNFKKKDDAQLFYKFEHMKKWEIIGEDTETFSIDAIRDKWYIND